MGRGNGVINILKMICAQLIVVHHFLGYGLISEHLNNISPNCISTIFEYSRMVVQIFLVIAGYFAIKTLLDKNISSLKDFLKVIINRYFRLVIPFALAILLAIISATISNELLYQEFIPKLSSMWQLLAHITLMHGIFDFDSLSSGVWYVAIDFQLFTLLTIVTIFKHKVIPALVVVLGLLSLYIFNLDSNYDNYAIYFFGSYSIGVIAFLYQNKNINKYELTAISLLIIGSLIINFRERILIAILCGSVLIINENRSNILNKIGMNKFVVKMSNSSYSLFLTHFSILMISNSLFGYLDLSPKILIPYLLITWCFCIYLSFVFDKLSNWITLLVKSKRFI